jgi:CrcB protein
LTWLLVGAGGALGAMTRHGAGVLTNRLMGSPMPYATAFVNIIGCAVIGVLAGGVASGHIRMSSDARLFVFVGILGGFTTFSSFGLDTLTLFIEGRLTQALLNVALQVGLGLAAVFVGYTLAK